MRVEPWWILSLAGAVFFVGVTGVLIRRNILIVLMSIELMLNAANLTFVTFARQFADLHGQVASLFIITVAAAESAVGLGIVIALYRTLRSADVTEANLLKE